MDKTIHCLDKSKVSQIGNTLIKFIGDNKTLFLSFQLQVLMVFSIKEFSCAVRKCISPDKKRRNNWKRKLWPITILSNLYKLFGQLMYGKTYDYFDKIHLKCLCEFGNENRWYFNSNSNSPPKIFWFLSKLILLLPSSILMKLKTIPVIHLCLT